MADDDRKAPQAEKPSLGQYLASIRQARKMTLRQVEEATNKLVSNAYLSQIENRQDSATVPGTSYSIRLVGGLRNRLRTSPWKGPGTYHADPEPR